MRQTGWFARRRGLLVLVSMGGAVLVSCQDDPTGIVVTPDGSGGGQGDGSSDAREGGGGAAGNGGSGGVEGGMADGITDATEDRSGDGSTPPLCVYHTEPPPTMLSLLDDGGADVTDDATSSSDAADGATADAGSADVTPDASGSDATSSDASIDFSGGGDVTIADSSAGGDASGDRSGGRDGDGGGDGAIPPSITIINSPFLGPYLADSAGRTLYTFGNDNPGDCMYQPVVDCAADCLIAWPPFDAGKRTLAPTLDPALFGSTALGGDAGGQITTYYGWPLYYYRSDTTGNVINGHGKSKTWHVATVTPPNLMIMRHDNDPRYIGDGTGHTLYVYDQDTAGTATSNPVSACQGDCLTQYPPFLSNKINAVSSLDPNDLTLFVRPEMSRQQVAYQGKPLYFSAADKRSGDQLGVSMGWTVAAAP